MKSNSKEKQNIVILGGGFAGVRAALDLSSYLQGSDECEIILVDRHDYQCYHAALYEAATTEHRLFEARKVKKTVAVPFAEIFADTKVKVFKAYIDSIDLENGKIVTDSRILPFDYLLICMGSVPDYYGISNLDKYGFALKNLEEAIMIRNRVEEIVSKKDSAQIVIGGGGFAGVEFAGEVYNLLKHECEFHKKDLNNFKILIVEGASNFLSGLSEKVSVIVLQRITRMGIKSRFSTLITEVDRDYVMLNKEERVACDLLIWTGGVRSIRLPIDSELVRDKKDRTETTPFLNLQKFPNVFIAGDNLCFIDLKTKKLIPQTAQEAIRQGRLAAKNIYRLIRGKHLHIYYAAPVRFVIPASGKFAIFYSPNLIISGFVGWLIRRFADLRYFMSILPTVTALRFWLFENKIFTKND